MSSLQDRLAALAAGDVVEIPGANDRTSTNTNRQRGGEDRTPGVDQERDRLVSLG